MSWLARAKQRVKESVGSAVATTHPEVDAAIADVEHYVAINSDLLAKANHLRLKLMREVEPEWSQQLQLRQVIC
eukprot:CFRG4169T1